MITPGRGHVAVWKEDGWTVYTTDGQPVVMFEHQILVTKNGYELLTHHLPI
jgi:methionyl aminopeptidase